MKPRALFYFLSFSVLLASCGDNSEYTTNKQTIRFVELGHGTAREDAGHHSKEVSDDESSTNDFVIADETDTIAARQGARFGVRYTLESNEESSVALRQVWTFPDSVHDEDGNVYKEDSYEVNKTPNTETYASYQLDYPYEVIRGKWMLRIYYKKHLLYRKVFVLI